MSDNFGLLEGWRRPLAWALLALVLGPVASAAVELSDLDQPVSLAVAWKFHPGDEAVWARADYDDSAWRTLRIPAGFRQDVEADLAWYRLTVQVGPHGRGPSIDERSNLRLGLTLGKVDSAYEVYAGGLLLGGVGALPPEERIDYDRHRTYAIPSQAVDPAGRLVIAVRVWTSPETRGTVGSLHEGPFWIGRLEALTHRELVSELPALFLAALFVVVGLFHLELFRR
ncbi:MAG: hypothetical protein AAF657_41290, partial [Acidobacteriota bacterium]